MEERIRFIIKIKGVEKPSPIIELKSKRDILNIKIQLNIKLKLFLPKEVNIKAIPIYYKLENQWKQLSDKESIQNFVESASTYVMVDFSRIKLEYQQLGKNFNSIQTQVSLHSVRVRTISGSQKEQNENQQIIQDQSITSRNPKIRILSSFVYDVKDEMKNKIESAGQEFQQKLKDSNKKKLESINNQFQLDKSKISDLEEEIIQCEKKKEQLKKILDGLMDLKKNQNQLIIEKKDLNINIDKKQMEKEELQNKIVKLQNNLISIAEKLFDKLKNIHINPLNNQQSYRPHLIKKYDSLASDIVQSHSQSTKNLGGRLKKIDIQLRSRQAKNLRIHTIYPANYEIGL